MKQRFTNLVLLALAMMLPLVAPGGLLRSAAAIEMGSQASGSQGAVVAGGAPAVAAGIRMLRSGGNAADAAVATILALSVTDSKMFCFGGEVPIIVYDAKRRVVEVVAGMGTAPRLATLEHFQKAGHIPQTGPQSAAVPATLDACLVTLDRYGTKRFAEVVQPALELLRSGPEAWHADLARTLERLVAAEGKSKDRRRGLRLVADYFYRGPIARELDAWSRSAGGLLRYEDLATHVTRVEDPVTAEYRGYTVVKCGPWTQGPYVLQALRLLEGIDVHALGYNSPAMIHATVEAMKLAMADRDLYYGDPLFADVPLEQLLSRSYADVRRPLIDPARASLAYRPGDPRAGADLAPRSTLPKGMAAVVKDTTTCLAADAEGNVIAATPSGWDGVVAGKTGVWLGTRLQSFNIWPGHPNCIAPGKRPRITLTPTLVLKDGKPAWAISVAGGDGQDQATLQMLIGAIDFGVSPVQAVTAPRFGTEHFVGSFGQTPPQLGSLLVTDKTDAKTQKALRDMGHRILHRAVPLWNPTMIRINRSGQRTLEAAGDPAAGRHAMAY